MSSFNLTDFFLYIFLKSILDHFQVIKKNVKPLRCSGGGVLGLSGLTTKKTFFKCVFPKGGRNFQVGGGRPPPPSVCYSSNKTIEEKCLYALPSIVY